MLDSREPLYKISDSNNEITKLLENYRKIFNAAKKHAKCCPIFERELSEVDLE